MSSDYPNSAFASTSRKVILVSLVVLMTIAYLGRLVQLQFIEGSDYRARSQRVIKSLTSKPMRGAIYDRHGRPIVQNEPFFSVTVTPKDFTPQARDMLALIIGVTPEEIDERVAKRRNGRFRPVIIHSDATFQEVAAIEENWNLLHGVEISAETKRTYTEEARLTHLLGYTKEINERQLNIMGDYYERGDMIGYSGLERTYEQFLRGRKGVEFVAYNALGQKVSSFNDGLNDILATGGFDLNLAIDLELQKMAEESMEGHSGAAVVLDPRNGEILAFVSKPDYDLHHFSGKTPAHVYNELRDDQERPFINRVTNAIYPPGSPFKMLVALAALEEGVIDEHSHVNCQGSYRLGNRSFKCHGGAHGNLNVRQAIKVSCNVFFYTMAIKLGPDVLAKYGQMFGFGEKRSIDILEENRGIMPDRAWMDKTYGKNGWADSRAINWGIGQGEITVTPLQVAMYTAVLANEGTLYQPHAVRTVYNRETESIDPVDYGAEELNIKKQYFDIVRLGMRDVVNAEGGTARSVRLSSIAVAGKTGTAQNPHGRDHAWFTCFAPFEEPEIVVTVIAENSGYGGAVAGPVCRKILEKYFGIEPKQQTPKPAVVDSTDSVQVAPPSTPAVMDSLQSGNSEPRTE